jgi:ribosomal-protein-alanine N-acetyltransferase
MIESFLTDRLGAERPRDDHLGDLCRMHQDPRVMATLGGLRSEEETRQFHLRNLDHWERHGYGIWMFQDRADRRFAGRGGLRRILVEGAQEVELAYGFMPEFWGRGLATEMARAILALAIGRLGLDELVCLALPTNLASRRVMEKAGFLYRREVIHAGLPHALYRTRSSVSRGPDALR